MNIHEDQIPFFIRQGEDRIVIKQLYKKVHPLVKKSILKNGGRKEDADDAFQDAIAILYQQIIKKTFNNKYKVYGYLYRLSINYWINKIKRDKKITLVEEFKEEALQEDILNWETKKYPENILVTLFAGIGEKCIELLTLTTYHDMLLEDIMLRMEFPSVDAVKMQVHRCKKKVIKEIENNPYLSERLRNHE